MDERPLLLQVVQPDKDPRMRGPRDEGEVEVEDWKWKKRRGRDE